MGYNSKRQYPGIFHGVNPIAAGSSCISMLEGFRVLAGFDILRLHLRMSGASRCTCKLAHPFQHMSKASQVRPPLSSALAVLEKQKTRSGAWICSCSEHMLTNMEGQLNTTSDDLKHASAI